METANTSAPSVVSTMVVHEPGDWFDETLRSLAAQDYPNFRTLFLLTPSTDEATVREAIKFHLPNAFIRVLPNNVSFGAHVDNVLKLVEGDNGFFLICHDDISLAHDAVRRLVEELFRSNAGAVGPKLVDWDHPRVLQHVGIGLDRLGEVDPLIEPGETDQEQHDAVRDVFVVPSACMLIRADLFRTIGGFDPAISFYGDDVELCWRIHLTGARVVVVPDARVRHRERLRERRPDLSHRVLQSRHRMRTVATLTGGPRLVVRSIQMLAATTVELVVGIFTGHARDAAASMRSLIGLIARTPALMARRRAVRPLRNVSEDDILALQTKGSARLATYLRSRETATYVRDGETVRQWREATLGPLLMWSLLILSILIGGRRFIRDAVPTVGEFLPLPSSPKGLWALFTSPFDHRSFGATGPNPTGYASLALSSVLTLFHNGLLFTLLVLGLPLLGALGMWRLADVFPTERARISATIVYLGTPLVPHLLGSGNFTGLVVFGSLPWLVHLTTRAAGIRTADPTLLQRAHRLSDDRDTAARDLADAIMPINMWVRVRYVAGASIVLALAVSLAPVALTIWLFCAIAVALGSLLARASWQVAAWFAGVGVVVSMMAFVLNLPWSASLGKSAWLGASNAEPVGRSLIDSLSMSSSSVRFGFLGLALYLPVIAAVALGAASRLTWAIRALLLVILAGGLLVALDRGEMLRSMPSASTVSVVLALGLALGAGALSGGLGVDVFQRDFGWRQPLAVVAGASLVVGLVPAILAIGNGRWDAPTNTLASVIESQFPDTDGSAEYRVLYLADASVLPVPGHAYRDGIEWVVLERGRLDFTDRFTLPSTNADAMVTRALDLMSSGQSLRAGKLLAPLGIHFIVVLSAPNDDDQDAEPNVPAGLVEALDNQLDLGVAVGPPTLIIYQNSAWLPVGAALGDPVAAATAVSNTDELVTVNFNGSTAVLPGIDRTFKVPPSQVPAGKIHLGIPFDEGLRLDVGGQEVTPTKDFGITTLFEVPTPGAASVSTTGGGSRAVILVIIGLLWIACILLSGTLATRIGQRLGAASGRPIHDDTLIDLDDEEFALDEGIWPSELDPSVPVPTGAIARRAAKGSRSKTASDSASLPVSQPLPPDVDDPILVDASDSSLDLNWADDDPIFADDIDADVDDDDDDDDGNSAQSAPGGERE